MERQRDKYVLSPSQRRDSVCQIETPSKMLSDQPPPLGESWHCPLYLPAPVTERSGRRESLGSCGWMAAGADCRTVRGRVRGKRESDEGSWLSACPREKRCLQPSSSAPKLFLLYMHGLSLSSPSHLCTGSCCLLALSD